LLELLVERVEFVHGLHFSAASQVIML
jgi:hypothetical protein